MCHNFLVTFSLIKKELLVTQWTVKTRPITVINKQVNYNGPLTMKKKWHLACNESFIQFIVDSYKHDKQKKLNSIIHENRETSVI